MRIFVAGGTGAIGRVLLPLMIAEGHTVVAMTRSTERMKQLKALGAEAVVGDVFDRGRLIDLVKQAQPEIVVHQLTAFGATDSNPLQETIRIRIEGTRNLVDAAVAAGARRFIAQSISFICSPHGGGLTDELTPLYLDSSPGIRPLAHAVSELERQTLSAPLESVVLRYGWFYGPGTDYAPKGSIPTGIRNGRMTLVGEAKGTYSFIELRDAARATLQALVRGSGIYNIVDDDPARLSDWLPFVANLLGAPPPRRTEAEALRAKLGDLFVYTMNEQLGASNAKAKRELDWSPQAPSWRQGFSELYSRSPH